MLKIFNSFTRNQEEFHVNINNTINMYVCGVTVYNFCHIGHGRTFVFFDVVVRYLRYLGYKLKYVRNITDIDDKIILKSIKNNEDFLVLSNRMIDQMHQDFYLLNILPPDKEPRVTENIDNIISMISVLLKNNNAYISVQGDVMFAIDSYPHYGVLSKTYINRIDSEIKKSNLKKDINKNNPLDFVLWKLSKKDEPFWSSPWGKGRPGWHIECSSMSSLECKNRIDIHGGGNDLLFPHHENELAQSTSANKCFIVKHWMHTGLVIIKDKKMSNSLKNTFLLKDLLLSYNSEVIRFFLLSTHYRHPLYFTNRSLKNAKKLLKKLYISLRHINLDMNTLSDDKYKIEFFNAMNNDFNIPKALSILFKLSHNINKLKLLTDNYKNNIKVIKLACRLKELGGILGLLLHDPDCFLKKSGIFSLDLVNKINILINDRNHARILKNWKEADRIRLKLFNLGVLLEDTRDGTVWRAK